MNAMNQIIVALDVDNAARAINLADELRGVIGAVKVGSQLFTAAGPDIVSRLAERGHRVFLDLKYHDIPNTVAGAATEAARLGAWMIDVHASGGTAMMRAARDAAHEAAAAANLPAPLVIGITVLTSLDADTLGTIGVARTIVDQVTALARLAQQAGLDGVVASPHELGPLRAACGRDFVLVTPGIRPSTLQAAARPRDDQARTMSAAEAVQSGASYIIVGRPIVTASNPRAAAELLATEIAARRSA